MPEPELNPSPLTCTPAFDSFGLILRNQQAPKHTYIRLFSPTPNPASECAPMTPLTQLVSLTPHNAITPPHPPSPHPATLCATVPPPRIPKPESPPVQPRQPFLSPHTPQVTHPSTATPASSGLPPKQAANFFSFPFASDVPTYNRVHEPASKTWGSWYISSSGFIFFSTS